MVGLCVCVCVCVCACVLPVTAYIQQKKNLADVVLNLPFFCITVAKLFLS